MKQIYSGKQPTHGVYVENNISVWGDRATAISHHWSQAEADAAAKRNRTSAKNRVLWWCMNKAAQALGRLARGKPKQYSAIELFARTERLKAARIARWKNHIKKTKL